jgi:hypothetical protein
MNITFLWFDECANHQQARQLLQEVMSERGVKGEVEEVNATSHEVAEKYRFPGSPTIRIDGADIEPGFVDPGDYTPRCRLYATPSGIGGLPERRWIEDAIDRALARK